MTAIKAPKPNNYQRLKCQKSGHPDQENAVTAVDHFRVNQSKTMNCEQSIHPHQHISSKGVTAIQSSTPNQFHECCNHSRTSRQSIQANIVTAEFFPDPTITRRFHDHSQTIKLHRIPDNEMAYNSYQEPTSSMKYSDSYGCLRSVAQFSDLIKRRPRKYNVICFLQQSSTNM